MSVLTGQKAEGEDNSKTTHDDFRKDGYPSAAFSPQLKTVAVRPLINLSTSTSSPLHVQLSHAGDQWFCHSPDWLILQQTLNVDKCFFLFLGFTPFSSLMLRVCFRW